MTRIKMLSGATAAAALTLLEAGALAQSTVVSVAHPLAVPENVPENAPEVFMR
jgi:hypothetical protein